MRHLDPRPATCLCAPAAAALYDCHVVRSAQACLLPPPTLSYFAVPDAPPICPSLSRPVHIAIITTTDARPLIPPVYATRTRLLPRVPLSPSQPPQHAHEQALLDIGARVVLVVQARRPLARLRPILASASQRSPDHFPRHSRPPCGDGQGILRVCRALRLCEGSIGPAQGVCARPWISARRQRC